MEDRLRDLCIKQGYVPSSECQLPGQLILHITQTGGNPCCGCNVSGCSHKLPYRAHFCTPEQLVNLQKEHEDNVCHSKEKRERINKRTKSDAPKVIMDVDVGRYDTTIKIYDLIAEQGFIKHLREEQCADCAAIICAATIKYKVDQIHIETNGCGLSMYDIINDKLGDSVDIVPLHCISLRL